MVVAEREEGARWVPTNSPEGAKNGSELSAVESGIDTWTLVRRLEDDDDFDQARCRFQEVAGRFLQLGGGNRVELMRGHRILRIEGHPAVEGLGHPTSLVVARDAVLERLRFEGLPEGVDGGFSRLDVTTTLAFERPEAGKAFLQGLAHLEPPRMGKKVEYSVKGGQVETVIWKSLNGKNTLSRAYDKGVESNLAGRGELIRLEGQHRFQRPHRMRAEVLAEHPHITENLYAGRFAPLAQAAEGVTAASMPALIEHLREKVRKGEMNERKAARALGFLAFGYENLPERTRYRWQKEVRELGLVLTDPLSDPIQVDVAEGIEAALAAWENEIDG